MEVGTYYLTSLIYEVLGVWTCLIEQVLLDDLCECCVQPLALLMQHQCVRITVEKVNNIDKCKNKLVQKFFFD